MKKSLLTTMTVDTFLFFTRMKEKGFTLLKARLQDLLTSLKTKLVFKKPTGKPKCKVDEYGTKRWCLHDEKVHPEQIVDYHLSRGTFCYYDKQTQTLHFDENK